MQYHSNVCRFPFDTKNPVGYSIAAILEYMASFNTHLVGMCITNSSILSSLIVISMADDIKFDFESFNNNAMAKGNPVQISKQFKQVIEFHSGVKQLSVALFNNAQIDLNEEKGNVIHSS